MRSRMRATVEQEPISNLSVDALATTQPDLQNRLMRQLSTKNAQDPLQKRPGAPRQDILFESIEDELKLEDQQTSEVQLQQSKLVVGQQDSATILSKSAINIKRSIQQKPNKKINKQVQRQYNPYSAECIKYFDGISRSEIDKLMIRIKKDKALKLKQRLDPRKEETLPRSATVIRESLDQNNFQSQINRYSPTQAHITDFKLKIPQKKSRSDPFTNVVRAQSHATRDMSMRARREQNFRAKIAASLANQPLSQSMFADAASVNDDSTHSQSQKTSCLQFYREVTTGEPGKIKGFFAVSKTLAPEKADSLEETDKLVDGLDVEKIPVAKNLVQKLKNKRALSMQFKEEDGIDVKNYDKASQKQQDKYISSFTTQKKLAKLGNNLNDQNLAHLVHRKYNYSSFQSGRETDSVFDCRQSMNLTSQSDVCTSTRKFLRQSISQGTSRGSQRRMLGYARHALKNKKYFNAMEQDLRLNSRANQVYSYPYASGNATEILPIDKTKLNPNQIQDLQTLSQDQARFQSYQEEPSPQTKISKTVNSVSFVKVRGQSGTLILNSNQSDTVPQDTALKQSQECTVRTDDGLSTTDEKSVMQADAATSQSQSAMAARQSYYVTPEDYNFEVPEPSKYYQKELFIKLPLCEPEEPVTKSKNTDLDIFKSAEFWLSRGHKIQSLAHSTGNRKNANEADNVALDYYLSGVKIDPRHYGCIYNAGCCHFFTGKFQNARKWFELTTRVRPLCPDGYYCKALACLRLGLYEEALESILIIDQYEESKPTYNKSSRQLSQQSKRSCVMEKSNKFSGRQITLLRAVCCKILNRHDEAELLYQRLHKSIREKQNEKMLSITFSVILVPLQKERTKTEKNVSHFLDFMNMYDKDYLYDESITKDLQRIGKPNTDLQEDKRLQFFAKYITKMPFFRRISERKLQSQYINKITLVERTNKQLVLIPDNNAVMVVLNGQIILRHHELDDPDDFDSKAVCKMGHILFAPELDENSNKPLVWPVVYSQKAQLALIQRSVFTEMWKDSCSRDLEVALSQLNLNLFFKNVSQQTFQRLINEKSHLKRFKKGQLVLPIHPRSPWNNLIYLKNQQKQTNILEQMEERHLGVSLHIAVGQKKEVSQQWQDMKQKQNQPPLPKMIAAMGVKLMEKVEKSYLNSRRDSQKDPSQKQNKYPDSQPNSTSSNKSGGNSLRDDHTDYKKLVKALQQNEPRYDDGALMRKALQQKKKNAQRKYRQVYLDQSSTVETQESDRTKSPIYEQQHVNPHQISFARPIMVLFKGSARCINNYFPGVSFTARRLATGSIIGESDSLQKVGIEFLGDIYAEQDGLICLIIERPDLYLDAFEIKVLQERLGKQHKELISMLETRFKELRENPIKEY